MADQNSLMFRYLLFHWVDEKNPTVLESMRQIESNLRMKGDLIVEQALRLFTQSVTRTEDRIVIEPSQTA